MKEILCAKIEKGVYFTLETLPGNLPPLGRLIDQKNLKRASRLKMFWLLKFYGKNSLGFSIEFQWIVKKNLNALHLQSLQKSLKNSHRVEMTRCTMVGRDDRNGRPRVCVLFPSHMLTQ